MNKYKKLIVLLLIIAVGVILFIYPKSFKQTYKDVQVYENGNFTDNGIYKCSLYNEKNEFLEDKNITFFITHDKSTLYIIMENKEFIYQYNTDEDYQKSKRTNG